MSYDTKMDKQRLAELAGSITTMHMHALQDLGPLGLTWSDLVYAAVLSLKALGQMHGDEDGSELEQVIEAALAQQVMGKHFPNREAAEEWLVEEGVVAPPGPTH